MPKNAPRCLELPTSDFAAIADRRRHTRAATVFTIGKLTIGSRELHCMVRDLSGGGMRVQMNDPPPVGTPVRIEMRGLDSCEAQVCWSREREAGLAFARPRDLHAIFEARVSTAGRIARSPRFAVMRSVNVSVDDMEREAMIWDLSAGGAKLLVAEPLAAGAALVVALGSGHSAMAASVRWTREDACGLKFVQPLSSVALSRVLSDGSG